MSDCNADYKKLLAKWDEVKLPYFLRSEGKVEKLDLIHFQDAYINSVWDYLHLIQQLSQANAELEKIGVNVIWSKSMLALYRGYEESHIVLFMPPDYTEYSRWQKNVSVFLSRLSVFHVVQLILHTNFNCQMSEIGKRQGFSYGFFEVIKEYFLSKKSFAYIDSIRLYKSWLYMSISEILMAKKYIEYSEYEMLHAFGGKVGLCEKDMTFLEILSQHDPSAPKEKEYLNYLLSRNC